MALLLLALTACSLPVEAPDRAGGARSDPLEYPTFEAVTSSRMFGLIGSDRDRVDLAEVAEQLETVGEINGTARSFAEQITGTQRSAEPSAELRPTIPAAERFVYALVPLVMMKLEPRWHTPTWSSERVDLANRAARILARIDGTPPLAFETGDDGGNRAGLETLVRWFHAAAGRPETLAPMIFTLDDGPFVGLPYDATASRSGPASSPASPWARWRRSASSTSTPGASAPTAGTSRSRWTGPTAESRRTCTWIRSGLLFYFLSW